MIAQLTGKVSYKTDRWLVVDVSGVGYKVFATIGTTAKLKTGSTASLWTYLAVRDNALDLYGFPTKEELDFFTLLISVSSIGPKTALGILNVTTIESLRKAIVSGETAHLTKVSGIGKKIADKIVLELKDKVGVGEGEDASAGLLEEVDALEALKSLGYKHNEAREALKQLDSKVSNTGERVKAALKMLGKK